MRRSTNERLPPLEPWYTDSRYALDPATVMLTQEETDYLDKLEHEIKLKLTPWQRAWYAKMSRQQGEHMKQEYPLRAAVLYSSGEQE